MSIILQMGVDTHNETITNTTKEDIRHYPFVSDKYTRYSDDLSCLNVGIKTSLALYGTYGLSSLSDVKQWEEKKPMEFKNSKPNRVDFAMDISLSLGSNWSELMLYGQLINASINGRVGNVYTTTKDGFDTKNIKVGKDRRNLTIYDCTDKEGRCGASTRIEFRKQQIRNTDSLATNTVSAVEEFIQINQGLVDFLPVIEKKYTKKLCSMFDKQKEKNPKLTVSKFVYKYSHHFLTGNILKEVYKHSKTKQQFSKWLRAFEVSNNLELDYCLTGDIKTMISDITRNLKSYKKS